MKKMKQFFKRATSLVLSLLMLLTPTVTALAAGLDAHDHEHAQSVEEHDGPVWDGKWHGTTGSLIAQNYSYTDLEKAILACSGLIGETYEVEIPTDEKNSDLVSVDAAAQTVTAKPYKKTDDQVWTPTKAILKYTKQDGTEGELAVTLDEVNGEYVGTFQKPANSYHVEVTYSLLITLERSLQQLLVRTPYDLVNGYKEVSGAYYAFSDAMELFDEDIIAGLRTLRDGAKYEIEHEGEVLYSYTFGLDENSLVKAAITNLLKNYEDNGKAFSLEKYCADYKSAKNKLQFMLEHGADMKADIDFFAEQIIAINDNIEDLKNLSKELDAIVEGPLNLEDEIVTIKDAHQLLLDEYEKKIAESVDELLGELKKYLKGSDEVNPEYKDELDTFWNQLFDEYWTEENKNELVDEAFAKVEEKINEEITKAFGANWSTTKKEILDEAFGASWATTKEKLVDVLFPVVIAELEEEYQIKEKTDFVDEKQPDDRDALVKDIVNAVADEVDESLASLKEDLDKNILFRTIDLSLTDLRGKKRDELKAALEETEDNYEAAKTLIGMAGSALSKEKADEYIDLINTAMQSLFDIQNAAELNLEKIVYRIYDIKTSEGLYDFLWQYVTGDYEGKKTAAEIKEEKKVEFANELEKTEKKEELRTEFSKQLDNPDDEYKALVEDVKETAKENATLLGWEKAAEELGMKNTDFKDIATAKAAVKSEIKNQLNDTDSDLYKEAVKAIKEEIAKQLDDSTSEMAIKAKKEIEKKAKEEAEPLLKDKQEEIDALGKEAEEKAAQIDGLLDGDLELSAREAKKYKNQKWDFTENKYVKDGIDADQYKALDDAVKAVYEATSGNVASPNFTIEDTITAYETVLTGLVSQQVVTVKV
ncbi:MAG: hypothetical protein IKU24_04595, partial [Clostridia bacterium]|nr:hypothetical protein [Clostridia bacterium]